MLEKISILKESGETVNSNVVSVFMIPDTQKRYLISTENTVDPHGLTVLHVSEIVDGSLQKIATDEEWASIKTIMRAIISGNVGSYQYLQTIDIIKASSQYSRDISVSASAAKQMSDNYAARDVNNTPAAVGTETAKEEVVPGISVVESQNPVPEVTPTPISTTIPEPVAQAVNTTPDVVQPIQSEPVSTISSVQSTPIESVPAPVTNPSPVPQTVVSNEPSVSTENPVVVPEPVAVASPPSTPIVAPVAEPAPASEIASVVVEPHLVASSPVTLPVDEPIVQTAPEPVTFVPQADLYAATTPMTIPNGQIAQEVVNTANLGIKFDINPSFSPNASLEEVVIASQEMFLEGVKNLVQTIQEKVYREMYNKEVELKAKEEMLNQREKMLNEQMVAMMSNFASMQGKVSTNVEVNNK